MGNVDLSKAKKGDKVKFRCGGEATIRNIHGPSPADFSDTGMVNICFEGHGALRDFFLNGVFRNFTAVGHTGTDPFDIIEVTP